VTRLGFRSIALLAPLVGSLACSSGDGAGPGGGRGGNAGNGGGGATGAGGNAGNGGTSGNAGTSGGGAGTVGVGGTGGASGSGGTTGGAGATGSGGRGGGAAGTGGGAGAAGGTGGASGSGGSGGRGGSSGTTGAGGTGTGGTGGTVSSSLKLEYQNSSATATTFGVRLTNLGPSTPLISAIKVRYYFHDDSTNGDGGAIGDATPMITAASWKLAASPTPIDLRQTPGCSITASFPAAPKSAYVDFGCGLTSPVNAQDTITFAITITPSLQLASNDYSYADTGGAFVANDHLLVLLNGVVQSGTPPP
jgi:hypothetical protein